MTLNINKCQFKSSELVYLGHKLTSNGIESDEGKIRNIVGLPAPEDKKGVTKKYWLALGRSTGGGSLRENQGGVGVKKMFGIL